MSSALRRYSLAVVFALLASFTADATNAPKELLSVATIAAAKARNNTQTPSIFVQEAGRSGEFHIDGACSVDNHQDDNGVILCDAGHNKLVRSFHGPVDLRWYGVADATSAPCLEDMTDCDALDELDDAYVASALYGNGGVTTGGRSVAFTSGDVNLIGDFTCETGATGQLEEEGDDYWEQAGAVVLNPAHSIIQKAGTAMHHCSSIRPSWLVPGWVPEEDNTLADTVVGMRLFTGTAIKCAEQACATYDMSIFGFDVCQDMTQSPFSTTHDMFYECHVGAYVHFQEGGYKIYNIQTKAFVKSPRGCWNPSGGCTITGPVHNGKWPITAVSNDGTGQIQVTIASGSLYMENLIEAGWMVLPSGLGDHQTVDVESPATLVNGSPVLTAVGLDSTGIVDERVPFAQVGFKVRDKDVSACIPATARVAVIELNTVEDEFTPGPPGVAKITMTANATCDKTFENIAFVGDSTANTGGNGMYFVASKSGQNIVLKGSSWAGPTYTSSWTAGAKAIVVFDTTNIKRNQYLCASGTAPYCTPPTGFTFSTTTVTDGTGVLDSTSATGNVTVGSTLHWPDDGYVKIGTEQLSYVKVSATRIRIRERGSNASTAATHANGSTVTASAPTVRAIVPSVRRDNDSEDNVRNFVVVNTAPYSSSSGNVQFANNTADLSSGFIGELNVLPVYQAKSALVPAGPVPLDTLTTTATGGSGVTSITSVTNWHKVFRGMRVRDITNPTRIPNGTTVTNDPSSGTITLSTATAGVITGDELAFDKCGYPGVDTVTTADDQWWLGNCTGTSFLATGSITSGNEGGVQGFNGINLHTANDRVALHLHNSPAITCTNLVFSSGGHSGAQRDDSSVTILITGLSDLMQCSNAMVKGKYIGVYNASTKNNDGLALSNFASGAWGLDVVNVGYKTNLALTQFHTKSAGVIFSDSVATGLILTGTFAPDSIVVTDDPAAYDIESTTRSIFCSSNILLTGSICADSDIGEQPFVVDSVAELRAGSFGFAHTLILKGYYAKNDGGGDILHSVASSSVDDSGSIFCDISGNCFQRQKMTGNVREFGAYCDVNYFASIGTTTASSTTITTGSYQAPSSAVGLPIVLPTSGPSPFKPQDSVTITAGGSGYAVGDTVTVSGGTGTAAVATVSTIGGGGAITAVKWTAIASYGSYTVIPSNPVSTTTSGAGTGATLTLKWAGTPLITTIASVGTNTLTLSAAPSVTQNTIPIWVYGHNDATAIQATIAYSLANTRQAVRFNGHCGSATQLELPAAAVASPNNAANPILLGEGSTASSIVAIGSMANLIHRASSPASRGGGASNITFDGMGLVTDNVLFAEGGSGLTFNNVNVQNATGSGNSVVNMGSVNATTWFGGKIRMQNYFSSALMPDYDLNANDEGGQYFGVETIGASIANAIFAGNGGHFSVIHTFGNGGPPPTYGVYIDGNSSWTDVQVDGATGANIYIGAHNVTLFGGQMNCGNGAVPFTNGVQIETAMERVSVSGMTYDSTCSWPASTRIVQSGTLAATSQYFGNAGAAYVAFNTPITQPGGRLSLSATAPVPNADVTAGTTIYYLPYVHNRVPTFNAHTGGTIGGFVSAYNIGSGMSMPLDSANTPHHVSGSVYDIFKITDNSHNQYLCTGPAWTSTSSRGTGAGTTELVRESNSGIWVNAVAIDCKFDTGNNDFKPVGVNMAIYLGSFYATADGQTKMMFAPAAAAGGGAPILGLYNAYNKVPLNSVSRSSDTVYSYTTATWRAANASNSNRITWLDGLADVAVRAQLTEYIEGGGAGVCNIGIDFDSTSATPSIFAGVGAAGVGTRAVFGASAPALGLRYAQHVEVGAMACSFAIGTGYEALMWSSDY